MTEQQFQPGDRVQSEGSGAGTVRRVFTNYDVLWDGQEVPITAFPAELKPYCDTCRNTGYVSNADTLYMNEPCPKGCEAPENAAGETDAF